MADTSITAAELGDQVDWQQTTKPRTMYGVYAGDALYHVMELDMRVQGGLTYGATNETNKTLTITLYGAFESGVDPGDAAAFPIDTTGFTVLTGSSDYTTTTDHFPYYLIRCKLAADSNTENVTVKACSWES